MIRVLITALVVASLTLGHAAGQSPANSATMPPNEQFHLFLLAGQSNMAGRGTVEDEDQRPHPRVLTYNQEGRWVLAIDPLHNDKPKVVGVGLGRTFALDYAEAHPDVTVGLIPCAHGGSPIGSWTPGGFHEQTQGHPYDLALERVQQASKFGTLKGILWHQGESDSNASLAPSHEKNLAILVDRLRAEFNAPMLPFVLGQMGVFPEAPWDEHRQTVDQAHKRIADRLPNCAFVSSLGLGHRGDKVHFDSAAYRELGHRYFAAYQTIIHRSQPTIVEVARIWDSAPHNAFTDLVRFNDRWFCALREGEKHVSADGALRIIESQDGRNWQSAALIKSELYDLRDAKLSVRQVDSAEGQSAELMLSGAGALQSAADHKHQSMAWFSTDGSNWSEAHPIGDRDFWLWRTTWHEHAAYSVGYATNSQERFVRLYRSVDGIEYTPLVDRLFDAGYPNESSMVFLDNGACYLLLRRDQGDSDTGQLGYSLPPYTDWQWQDLGVRIGGPHMLMLPDGRLVAAVRLLDGHVRTALCWVDPQQGKLTEFLRLPSGGDTSYAGLVWHEDRLWVSYYSSHEKQGNPFSSAIYLAQVRIP